MQDEDPLPALVGPQGDVVLPLAHRIDLQLFLARRLLRLQPERLDHHAADAHIRVIAALDSPAGAAGQAGIRPAGFTVQRLGHAQRQQRLADAGRPAQKVSVRHTAVGDRPPQQIDRPFVADDGPVHRYTGR